ncbi:D-inositol-3-phosphate glycosyltransferase, partial [Streptomyces mirabilis]
MSQYVSRLGRRSPATPSRLRLHRRPRRVAMLSVHTSPLHQPGTGDAGGMNVYIVELAQRLAAINIEVEIFTRATTAALPPTVELAPGVLVRHVDAGPYEGLAKEDLPAQLCAFTHGVMQAWAGHRPGYYDLVHSHYWLSGHVGWLAAERWGAPLVHAMHTMAKVKNAALAEGDTPEPAARVIGETQIVRAADRLIANTSEEADELARHYEAEPGKVAVVHPGVNLDRFRPADGRAAARARLGLPQDALIPLFAGRIQPLKAPDVLLRAVAVLLDERPELRGNIVVPVVGGPSGTGLAKPEGLQKLAARLGIDESCPVADGHVRAAGAVVDRHRDAQGAWAGAVFPVPVRDHQGGGRHELVVHGVRGALGAVRDAEFGDEEAVSGRGLRGAAGHAGGRGPGGRGVDLDGLRRRLGRSYGWCGGGVVLAAVQLRGGGED